MLLRLHYRKMVTNSVDLVLQFKISNISYWCCSIKIFSFHSCLGICSECPTCPVGFTALCAISFRFKFEFNCWRQQL